jgi:hypothetical protein
MPVGPFSVPQFIDVESKIIGPITTRQFLIMMVAGMICFILYKTLYFTYFVIFGFIVIGIFGMVAFLRVNGMPFHYFFLNLMQTLKRARLRIWAKEEISGLPKEVKKKEEERFVPKPPLSGERLSTLTLIVNTGGAYKEE